MRVILLIVIGITFAEVLAFAADRDTTKLDPKELALVGGAFMACQCPPEPCIQGNPGNGRGSKDCTIVGAACTTCNNAAGGEDLYTPLGQMGTQCNSICNEKDSNVQDCTGTIFSGTCAASASVPWGFTCTLGTNTSVACAVGPTYIYRPIGQ